MFNTLYSSTNQQLFKKNLCNQSIAVSSKFGWLLSGPINSVIKENDNLIIEGHGEVESLNQGIDLTGELQRFWDTEVIGITETVTDPEKSLPFTEIAYDWNIGRYKVKLLWKADLV